MTLVTLPGQPNGAAAPAAPGPPVRRATILLRDRVGPLLEKMAGGRLYVEARGNGFPNLSAFLEAEDPSDPEERHWGLDAFQRVLRLADIKTTSDRYGAYRADTLEAFAADDAKRSLFAEWARRQWVGQQATRAQPIYLSGEYLLGSAQRRYDDDPALRMIEVEPAIPLSEVVARTRPVDGPDFRTRQLVTPTPADVRMLRVAEGAEIPAAKIQEASRANRLNKFGRKLEATYEALRRMPLDEFATYVRLLSIYTEVDQVAAVIDVMVNGDGNAGTAGTVWNLTALDPATTANNLTITAWLAFLAKFANPYQMTGVIGQQTPIIKLLTLTVGTANVLVGSAEVPNTVRQTFVPMTNRTAQAIRYGISTDAPASQLIGFDGRFAIEHVVERGSDISESERWITRQVEVLTFTFNEAFAVANTASVQILNLAA